MMGVCKSNSVLFSTTLILTLTGCATVSPPTDMKHEPAGSAGYDCYYDGKCRNTEWALAAGQQHNAPSRNEQHVEANNQNQEMACTTDACLGQQAAAFQRFCYEDKIPGGCYKYAQLREKRNDDLPLVVQVFQQACNDGDQRGCEAVTRLQPVFSNNPNCVDIKRLPYRIVQKLDDHHYEMVAETNDPGAIHAMLETKKAIYESAGHPTGVGVEHLNEMRKVTFKDGFVGQVRVYRECAIVPYANANRFPGIAYRKTIGGH